MPVSVAGTLRANSQALPAQSANLLLLPFHRRTKAEAMPIPSITSALRKRRLRVLIAGPEP